MTKHWRERPTPIEDTQIERILETDIAVLGLGYAGGCAARAAAEEGCRVIGIDLQTEDHFNSFGRDIGHINSDFLASRDVPSVDPIELFREMMRRAGNRANPRLVMQYVQNCGTAFDWFVNMYSAEELLNLHVAYWPGGASKFKAEKDFESCGYHFWNGTAQFPDRGPNGWPGSPTLTEALLANHKAAEEQGATLLYGQDAVDLIIEDNKVCGVLTKDRKNGSYSKILTKKAVILSTGGFAGNPQMVEDLVTDIADLRPQGQEPIKSMGRQGRGIQLGVWAGGRLEPKPIPVMGGNYPTMPGLSTYGVLWLDRDCNRFCNEVFGGPELSGFAYNQMPKGTYYNVFDEHVLDDLAWAVPAHGGFDEADPRNVNAVTSLLERGKQSVENGTAKEGVEFEIEGFHFPWCAHTTYCGRTPEELAENAGLTGKKAQAFIASIHHYNDLCRRGRDEDFGKDAKLLRPLEGYLYLQPTEIRDNGFTMATLGGLVTNENQVVLDDNYEPIAGLYATGNCCGRRFGSQYSTPIAGLSIGMAITLGRLAGQNAARQD